MLMTLGFFQALPDPTIWRRKHPRGNLASDEIRGERNQPIGAKQYCAASLSSGVKMRRRAHSQIDRPLVRLATFSQVACAFLARLLVILAIPILLGSFLEACGGEGGGGGPVTNLQSLTIEPVNSSIAAGTTLQLHATGTYKNKTTKDLTDKVTWRSKATDVASVSNATGTKGLASGAGVGATTIIVELHGRKGVSKFTVTKATLTSITVFPANPLVAKGTTVQLSAKGNFSDGSSQDLTTQVSWSSGNTGIAQVSNASGTMGAVTG